MHLRSGNPRGKIEKVVVRAVALGIGRKLFRAATVKKSVAVPFEGWLLGEASCFCELNLRDRRVSCFQ